MPGSPAGVLGAATSTINPLLGAGIGVATSGINSMLQNIGNRRQNHRMVEFWKMNNEYNHPSAQMARMREAGLNPALMYGQNAGGAAGNSSAPPKPVQATPMQIKNPATTFMNYQRFKLENDNLRAQNTDILNSSLLKYAGYLKTMEESKIKGTEAKAASQRIGTELEMLGMKAAKMLNQNMQTNFSPEQTGQIKKANFDSIMNRAKKLGTDASNSEKLGLLREAELKIKNKQLDFYDSNAILGILKQILGLVTPLK